MGQTAGAGISGARLAELAALLAADTVVIPVLADKFSLDGAAAVAEQANRLAGVRPRLRVRALLTQTRGTEVVTAAATMLTQMRLPVYRTAIRRTDKVPESTMTLLPLRQYSPGSAAARDYRAWAKDLMAGKNFDISRFAETITPVRSESDTMREIAIDKIRDNPRNFYPAPGPAALAALEDSIRANGLLEPPTVIAAEDGTSYRLISGHSRMAALRALHAKTPEQWETVSCRVLPTMSEEAEASAVIEANRQRVKSPALLAEEAERLTELYIKRREAGEDLPGRIRDRVAEALQVKSTKIANVTAIKNGIKVPGIAERWKRDEIPEAAALMIARMDIEEQYRLLDWMIDKGRSYTINEVRKFDTCYHNAKKAERQPTPEPEQEAEALPEGQMVICGWMPGGTTPAEPGEFAVVVDVGGGKRLKRFFEWDGHRWMMTGGIEASIAPAWWMRLPPVPDKEG